MIKATKTVPFVVRSYLVCKPSNFAWEDWEAKNNQSKRNRMQQQLLLRVQRSLLTTFCPGARRQVYDRSFREREKETHSEQNDENS